MAVIGEGLRGKRHHICCQRFWLDGEVGGLNCLLMIVVTRIGCFYRVAARIFRGSFCIGCILCVFHFIGKLGGYILQAYACHRRGGNGHSFPIVCLIRYGDCCNRNGGLTDRKLPRHGFGWSMVGITRIGGFYGVSACVHGGG